jgi:septal ring factor EnvC (AmiA/AmiB activator)
MSAVPASPSSPRVKRLEARLRSLDFENQQLRSRLEEQSQRLAQLTQENDSLKTKLVSADLADPDQAKAARRGSGVLSNEEMDFALSMARNTASPAAG